MPEITLGITRLHEIFSRVTGLKDPIGDPLVWFHFEELPSTLSKFLDFTEKESFHRVRAFVILSVGSIIRSAVGENPHHIGGKKFFGAKITTL